MTNNGADWKQLSDLSSLYFLTYHRCHTPVGFRSRYRQPCDFHVGWRGQSWPTQKKKKAKKGRRRKRKAEGKKERRGGKQGRRNWIHRHPLRFRLAPFDHPRFWPPPGGCFFRIQMSPSGWYFSCARRKPRWPAWILSAEWIPRGLSGV